MYPYESTIWTMWHWQLGLDGLHEFWQYEHFSEKAISLKCEDIWKHCFIHSYTCEAYFTYMGNEPVGDWFQMHPFCRNCGIPLFDLRTFQKQTHCLLLQLNIMSVDRVIKTPNSKFNCSKKRMQWKRDACATATVLSSQIKWGMKVQGIIDVMKE